MNPALVNMLDQSNIATSLVQNKVVSDEIPYTDFSTITKIFKISSLQPVVTSLMSQALVGFPSLLSLCVIFVMVTFCMILLGIL